MDRACSSTSMAVTTSKLAAMPDSSSRAMIGMPAAAGDPPFLEANRFAQIQLPQMADQAAIGAPKIEPPAASFERTQRADHAHDPFPLVHATRFVVVL
jgi:hypothetical protein